MELTFAPGWTQEIDTGGDRERDDLMSYISDTFKALNGFRPRWGADDDTSIRTLRKEAVKLQVEVMCNARREVAQATAIRREKAAHKAAMKYYINLKPRGNVMEMAMLDAMDK